MVTLRKADDADSWFFWTLRTDPDAARASHRPPPTREEHDRYWKSYCDERYVIYVDEEPSRIGTLRISGDGYVSIVIEEQYRGRGYGRGALEAVIGQAKGRGRLFAEVAPENEASQRAFLGAGWKPTLFEVNT